MLRRFLTLLLAIALVGSVASLVYLNGQPTTLKWGPRQEITLPLAWLIVTSTGIGALLMLVLMLAREGHWALRQWRLVREIRHLRRLAARRSEARTTTLAGRHTKARALLAKTAMGTDAIVDDAVDYGESFLTEGLPAEGRTHLEAARRDLGDDPRVLFALARCCRAVGDNAVAAGHLERAVETLPTSVPLHSLLRDCLVDLEWWPRAEVAQQRLVDLHPGDEREKSRLIDIRMKAADHGDQEDREAALRGVLAMDPSWPAAAAGRAAMLRNQGQHRAATRVLYRAAKRRAAEETMGALDETLEESNPKRLLRLYSRLRRTHPGNTELTLRHAALLLRLGRSTEAEALVKTIEGATGREAVLMETLRAKMLEGRADSAGAAQALRRALEQSLKR